MTPLWVLRHAGAVIACAPSRPEIIEASRTTTAHTRPLTAGTAR